MLKHMFTFFLCFLFSLGIVCGGMFGMDYYRCSNLEKPMFAIGIDTADDGGSGTYYGIGYTVEIDGELSAEYGYQIRHAEMYLLGQLVFAAIT